MKFISKFLQMFFMDNLSIFKFIHFQYDDFYKDFNNDFNNDFNKDFNNDFNNDCNDFHNDFNNDFSNEFNIILSPTQGLIGPKIRQLN